MSRYFISIDGKCKLCDYPIICDAGDILDKVPDINGNYMTDYHLYCSNPDCRWNSGVSCCDTDLDENHVPFMKGGCKL
jgi:hypothetical protein